MENTVLEKIKVPRGRAALLLVDVQSDFMPGGALAVGDGDAIVPPLARLMATQDWHPAGYASFASQHAGHQPMDRIQIYGHEQILWPDHCAQGSPGATLHPGLPWQRVTLILRKGIKPGSGCRLHNAFQATGARVIDSSRLRD